MIIGFTGLSTNAGKRNFGNDKRNCSVLTVLEKSLDIRISRKEAKFHRKSNGLKNMCFEYIECTFVFWMNEKIACEVNRTSEICSCKIYCARIAVVAGALTLFFVQRNKYYCCRGGIRRV